MRCTLLFSTDLIWHIESGIRDSTFLTYLNFRTFQMSVRNQFYKGSGKKQFPLRPDKLGHSKPPGDNDWLLEKSFWPDQDWYQGPFGKQLLSAPRGQRLPLRTLKTRSRCLSRGILETERSVSVGPAWSWVPWESTGASSRQISRSPALPDTRHQPA